MGGDDASSSSALVGLVLRGTRAYLTGSTARELFRSVDVGALLDGQRVGDAIERDQAGKALGRLLGRALADELAEGDRVQAFAVRLAGQRVGAHLGQAAIVALLEYGLLASALDELRGMTEDEAVIGLLDEIEAVATPGTTDGTAGPSSDSPASFDGGNDDLGTTGFDVDTDPTSGGSEFNDRR